MSPHKYPVGSEVWAFFKGLRRAVVVKQMPEVYVHLEGPLYEVQFGDGEPCFHYRESQLLPYIPQPETEEDHRISLFDLIEVKEKEATYSMTVTGMEVKRMFEDYGYGKRYYSPIKYSGYCMCCGSEKRVHEDRASIKLIKRGSEDAVRG